MSMVRATISSSLNRITLIETMVLLKAHLLYQLHALVIQPVNGLVDWALHAQETASIAALTRPDTSELVPEIVSQD